MFSYVGEIFNRIMIIGGWDSSMVKNIYIIIERVDFACYK